jgi:predicted nucleic acid-binding protein
MIVVSDTSPLNYLVLIGAIDVLPKLFREVHVPPAVMRELKHARTPDPVKRWSNSPPDWLLMTAPSGSIPLDPKLDPGESEAIALAIELHAAAILVDEKKGRRIAQSQGIATLGTITVLELASELKLLDLPIALEALQRTTFHVTKTLIDDALERDAARKRAEQGERWQSQH